MIEVELREVDLAGRVGPEEILPWDGVTDSIPARSRIEVGHHHHSGERRQPVRDRGRLLEAVIRSAVVGVAVGSQQDRGIDLPETIHHCLDAEVRRACAPDRAEAGGAKHRDDRLRHVGQVSGYPIPGTDAGRSERLPDPGDLVVEPGEAEPAYPTVLEQIHEGIRRVAPAKQVLGEVQARPGEPSRPGHPVHAPHHLVAPTLGNHAAEIPNRGPEPFRVLDGEIVEGRIAVDGETPVALDRGDKRGQVSVGDALGGGLPDGLFHRSSPTNEDVGRDQVRSNESWSEGVNPEK